MGKEHLLLLVSERDGLFGTKTSLYGLGSNIWGQLLKDPFRYKCITKLRQVRPKALKKCESCEITDIACGKHHTIVLCDVQVDSSAPVRQQIVEFGNCDSEKRQEKLFTERNVDSQKAGKGRSAA